MNQLTLGQAKPQVASMSGNAGMVITDALVIQSINNAVQELMMEGDWPNVVDRYHVLCESGEITLPSHLDRLMQANIRGVPQTIASPWWQFVAYGPGTEEDRCGCGQWWGEFDGGWMISDRGEFPTRVSIPEDGADGPWTLLVTPQVQEAADACVTIQGLDGDGLVIRTDVSDGSGAPEWINGIRVPIDGTAGVPVSDAQVFSEITAFTKETTNGYIKLEATNGTDTIELSNYLFSDTTPSFHRYFSQWLDSLSSGADDCLRFVRARCRKRFVPASLDTDVLIITNLNALKEMVIAQWKRAADDTEGYTLHKVAAVDLMKKEAAAYRGKSRIPGLTFQRGFPVGSSLPALR